MLDIIVIGRDSFKSASTPQVIYCGDSRSEAKAAALAADPKFVWVYEVNGMVSRNYRTRHSAGQVVTATNDEQLQASIKRVQAGLTPATTTPESPKKKTK